MRDRPAAAVGDGPGDGGEIVRAAGSQDEVVVLRGEKRGELGAEPAARAGDQCYALHAVFSAPSAFAGNRASCYKLK